MPLSKEFYDYELTLLKTDNETGKPSLNHIKANDPRLKKLQKLANAKPRNRYSKKRTNNIEMFIRKQEEEYFEPEAVNWKLIKYRRGKMNLTQHDMAKLLNLSKNFYQAMENRKYRVKRSHIINICIELGIDLIEKRGYMPPGFEVEESSELKRRRKELNMSQMQVAKLAGLSQGRYSEVERSGTHKDKRVMDRVYEVLGIKEDKKV